MLEKNPELLEKMETVEMQEETIDSPQVEAAADNAVANAGTSDDGWTLEDKIDFLMNRELDRAELEEAKAAAKIKAEQEAKDKRLAEAEAKLVELEKAKAEAEAKAKEAAEKPAKMNFNPEETVAQAPQKAPGMGYADPNSLKQFDQTDKFFAHLVPGARSDQDLGKA